MEKIYYKDDTITIYNSNMEDIIDKLNFNIIITDPPYNIKYKYNDYNDNLSDEKYIELFTYFQGYKTVIIHYMEYICNYICKGIGPVSKIISWCYNNNSSSKAHRAIAFFNCYPDFKKVKQPYKNYKDKRIQQLIKKGSTGARLYDWFNDINLIKNVSKEKCKSFTNQIPIKLLERIILLISEPDDVILDPFFGSGSIYFACKNLGRKCIGIEQSSNHLKSFLERLNKS